jgi:hypothetical protein
MSVHAHCAQQVGRQPARHFTKLAPEVAPLLQCLAATPRREFNPRAAGLAGGKCRPRMVLRQLLGKG